MQRYNKCFKLHYNYYLIQIFFLGFPLTISLIGAQLETHKEETINSTDRWTFYLDQLSDKRKRNNIEPFK